MAAVIFSSVGWIRFFALAGADPLGSSAGIAEGAGAGAGLLESSWLCLSSSLSTLVNLVIKDEGATLPLKELPFVEGAGRSLLGVSQLGSPLPLTSLADGVAVAEGVPETEFLVGTSRVYSQVLGISRSARENFSRISGLTAQQDLLKAKPWSLGFL